MATVGVHLARRSERSKTAVASARGCGIFLAGFLCSPFGLVFVLNLE